MSEPGPIEVRRFGVGHRRPDGPPGTTGITGQVIESGPGGVISELAFSREARINQAFVTLADTLIAEYDVVDLLHTLLGECLELVDVQIAADVVPAPTGL